MAAPKKVIKVGKVRLSVWEGDYQGTPTLSFTLDKPYKTKDGEYKTGKSFNPADLGNVVLVCIKAQDLLYPQKNAEPKQEADEPDDIPF